MDNFDRAQELEQRYRRGAIAHAQAKAREQESRAGSSLLRCAECGAPIPEQRRKAVPGCRLCVACQQEHDNRTRGRL